MDVSAEIHCGKCGSANYSLPSDAESRSAIVCNDCGHVMGDIDGLMNEVLAQIRSHSAEALRRDLGRINEAPETSTPA